MQPRNIRSMLVSYVPPSLVLAVGVHSMIDQLMQNNAQVNLSLPYNPRSTRKLLLCTMLTLTDTVCQKRFGFELLSSFHPTGYFSEVGACPLLHILLRRETP